MGSLNFPDGSLVYLDASVPIYIVERHPRYSTLLEPLLERAANRSLRLVSSELTIVETLVLPLRRGNGELVNRYHEALFRSELELIPISKEILLDAALLRAHYSALRTPDAIHWATMRFCDANYFLTNDASLAAMIGAAAIYLENLAQKADN
jgi:predicted nucleic acid-binding protein